MLKNIKLRGKITLLPLIAAIAFVLIMVTNKIIGERNEKLLINIETGYSPALEISRDMETMLANIQRGMQDSVAAGDEGMLNETGVSEVEFKRLLGALANNAVIDKKESALIASMFEEYYSASKTTCQRIIKAETGEDVTNAIEDMRTKYNLIKQKIDSLTVSNKKAIASAFLIAKKSQQTTLKLMVAITLLGLVIMIAFSAWIIRGVITPFRQCVEFAQRVGQGDLSKHLEIKTKDETRELGNALNAMLESMRFMIGKIKDSNGEILRAISDLRSSIVQQTQGIGSQATAVSQISTTINELKTTSKQTAQFAIRVLEDSERSVDVSREGLAKNQTLGEGMDQIKEQMETIAETILSFSERSQQIVDIITTVNDLAHQSNFLALNASIEAAKAGEQGKGFAVVAMEVRNLAEQSQEATAQIRSILNEIQNAINSAVIVTENGTKRVQDGVVLSKTTGDVIKHLSEVVNEGATSARQISASASQQSVGIDQIAQGMNEISKAMSEASVNSKMVEETVKGLGSVGERFSDAVNKYVLGDA